MSSGAHPSFAFAEFRADELLIKECLLGSEAAWSELIDKYKRLIFSIPIKDGLSRDDATEIFQSVCLTLLQELPKLREPRAISAWLIKLTVRKCTRLKRDKKVFPGVELDDQSIVETTSLPDELLSELERQQILREAIGTVSAECQQLIDVLFFTNPPVPYNEAAAQLGLATGSIGATRMRCLEKMKAFLLKKGFPQ